MEDEKEEVAGNKLLSETIQKRRKNQKHIEMFPPMSNKIRSNQQIIIESDPIYEEIEIEDDDDAISENNFTFWENHKRLLLTQDEQQRHMNEDARSDMGYHPTTLQHSNQNSRRGGLMSGRFH